MRILVLTNNYSQTNLGYFVEEHLDEINYSFPNKKPIKEFNITQNMYKFIINPFDVIFICIIDGEFSYTKLVKSSQFENSIVYCGG